MKLRFSIPAVLLVIAALVLVTSLLEQDTGRSLGYEPQVFVVNADGTGLRQLTKGKGYRSSPTWSFDGFRLAYTDGRIRIVGRGFGRTRTLAPKTGRGGAGWIQWSPTREELLFTHGGGTENHPRSRIAVIRLLDGHIRRLVSWPSMRSPLDDPVWSPNGNLIAYMLEGKPISSGGRSGIVGGGHFDIAVVSRTGKRKRRFRIRGDELQPRWSPDGRRILFGRNGGGQRDFELMVISPRGRGLHRLGPKLVRAEPTWSPDGRRIAFTGHAFTGARDQALWVMDAKPAAAPHLIVDHVAGSAWSPAEEDVIAFADFDGHIGVVAPDGSARRDIATFAENTEFRDLAWSPDGRRLAFTAEKQRPSD